MANFAFDCRRRVVLCNYPQSCAIIGGGISLELIKTGRFGEDPRDVGCLKIIMYRCSAAEVNDNRCNINITHRRLTSASTNHSDHMFNNYLLHVESEIRGRGVSGRRSPCNNLILPIENIKETFTFQGRRGICKRKHQ